MAFTPYATNNEVKSWVILNDALDDAIIDDTLESVTRWIDEHCQRHFWPDGAAGSEVARRFATCNRWQLDLGAFHDLTSVTEVATDESGDGTFETVWAASDYELLPVNRPTGRPYTHIDAVGTRTFPLRWSQSGSSYRVRVTGVWGWPAVPETVRQACLIQTSRIMKRRYSPEGVAGFNDILAVRVSRLDPDVMELLNPYRRVAVLVA